MSNPKGWLATLLGLDASGVPYALAVDEDGYVRASLPGQAGGGTKRNPKGLLISPVGFSPTGVLKNLQMDAGGNLIITLVGGSANEIIKSDGTDAEWDTLADVIEAAILTTDGDILIRSGGVAQRLAKPAVGQILGESGQIPAWIAKPTGGYTEGARVYNSADITIPDGDWTALTFDSEDYDTDAIHSTVSNTNKLTCKTAGKYWIHAQVTFKTNANGGRALQIRLNGTTSLSEIEIDAVAETGWGTWMQISTEGDMSINDYVEIMVYQNSGGTLDVDNVVDDVSPVFIMRRTG